MTEEPRTEPGETESGAVSEPAPADAPTSPVGSADQPTVEAQASEPAPTDGHGGPPPWVPPSAGDASPPSPSPVTHHGIFVPRWLLLTISGLLVLGLGFLGGFAVGRHRDHDERRGEVSFDFRGRQPFMGGNGSPFGPNPGNNNGNGDNNGNGSRNGPGAPASTPVYLGVAVRNSSDPVGAEIARVAAASPAARAGLRAGDVVTALDSDAIRNASELTTSVRAHRSGDQVTVKYTRDGASKTAVVRLGSRPQTEQQ